MDQVLVIHPPGPLSTLLELNLATSFNVNIINKNSAAEACHILKLLPDVGLIITADKCGQEETIEELLTFLDQSQIDTKLVVLGTYVNQSENILTLKEYSDIDNLIDQISEFYYEVKDKSFLKEKDNFHSYPAKFLLEISTPPCDVFIRLHKGHGVYHHIKRLNKDESYNTKDIQRYIDHGLEFFFVHNDDVEVLTTEISNQLIKDMSEEKNSSKLTVDIVGDAYTFASQLLKDIGFKTASTVLVEGVLHNIEDTLLNTKFKSKDVIDDLLNSKTTMFYKLSHLTSIIGGQMITEADWGTTDLQRKLAFASFFNDITLPKESMLFCRNNEDIRSQYYSPEEVKIISRHAKDAAELIQDYPDRPQEVDNIILQHHGSIDGLNLRDDLPQNLTVITYVLMIAEQFSLEIIKNNLNNNEMSADELIRILQERNQSPRALKAIDLLIQSLEN
jgi:hypothetical protein